MNKRNYQNELDKIIKENASFPQKPSLLLHVCCAPCSSYCLEYLTLHFDVTVLYSNSNIDDPDEYCLRRNESERLTQIMNEGKWMEGNYTPEVFHELVKGHELDQEGGERCEICFRMRLEEAAAFALKNGFDYFTTSLTISPLKDADKLNRIGEELALKYKIKFLPSDFKKKGGYQRSIELSKEYGLYRQNYCGCSYSKFGGNNVRRDERKS